MSERRPHWDDELIEAVVCYTGTLDDAEAAIAAVEDWHRQRAEELSVVDIIWAKARVAQAEATIQRLRGIEPVFPPDNSPPWVHGEARGWNKALDEVRRALDGEAIR